MNKTLNKNRTGWEPHMFLSIKDVTDRFEALPHWRLKSRDTSRCANIRMGFLVPLHSATSEITEPEAGALIAEAASRLTTLEAKYPEGEAKHADEDTCMREVWEIDDYVQVV